ncbi:MAG: ThiF family adenylyltransferase [Fidelibacterota bacterium]
MTHSSDRDVPKHICEAIRLLRKSGKAGDISEPTPSSNPVHPGWYEFSCVVRPQVPAGRDFPHRVALKLLLHSEFPGGGLEVYPLSESIRDYAHQEAETGKICLRPDYQAPHDIQRLLTYVCWAREWLEDAAADTLLKPNDPYELPDFRRKHAHGDPLILFQEDKESFEWWQSRLGTYGVFKYVASSDRKAMFVGRFLASDGERPLVWGTLVPDADRRVGLWILCSRELVIERRRPPLTWGELRSLLRADGVDLRNVLLKYWDSIFSQTGQIIWLVGFPIPERVGEEPTEIHWQPVITNNWTIAPKKLPGGFRRHSASLALFVLNHAEGPLRPNAHVPWGNSTNISPGRYFGRGPLPSHLQLPRVALIGCGALGSAIADLMVRGGLRHMDLFDRDLLLPGNFSRHQCGFDHLRENKAVALAAQLASASPHLHVFSYPASLPLDGQDEKAEEALRSADVWIDCSADEGVFLRLNRLAQSLGKKLIHVYVTWGAKYLCACSAGGKTTCKAVHDSIMAERGGDTIPGDFFQLPKTEDLILEGPGCWHPTFPGPCYSIRFLASYFLGQIVRLAPDQWVKSWGFVIRNPWVVEREEQQVHPLIWSREFQ